MNEELRQAIKLVEEKEKQYELIDPEFESVAYYEWLAATARVNILLREARGIVS